MPVTLYYYTGWQECQLHGCPKGDSAWRDMAFKTVPGKPSVHELHVEADGLEFVVCDMQKKYWDNPPDWYGKKNYLISEAGKYSLRNGHLRRRRSRASCALFRCFLRGMGTVIRDTPVLVVTDLDHTLIGHERDPENKLLEDFKTTWLGEYAPNGSALAYSTGRNKSMALDVAKERHLPRPELLICGVGTEVYAIPSSLPLFDWWEAGASLQLMPEWKSKVLDGFDRKYVEEIPIDILLAAFPKFELRGTPEAPATRSAEGIEPTWALGATERGEYSWCQDDPYRIPTAYQMDENFDAGKRTLQETLGEKYQVISSGHGEWKLIDICSSQAGKGKALEFAQRELKFEPGRTLACGDSGNDELMFRCDGSYGAGRHGTWRRDNLMSLWSEDPGVADALLLGAVGDLALGTAPRVRFDGAAGAAAGDALRFRDSSNSASVASDVWNPP
eukprot:g22507.t1